MKHVHKWGIWYALTNPLGNFRRYCNASGCSATQEMTWKWINGILNANARPRAKYRKVGTYTFTMDAGMDIDPAHPRKPIRHGEVLYVKRIPKGKRR